MKKSATYFQTAFALCGIFAIAVFPGNVFAQGASTAPTAISSQAAQGISAIIVALTIFAAVGGTLLIFLGGLLPFKRVPRDKAISSGWNSVKNNIIFFFGITILFMVLLNSISMIENVLRAIAPVHFFSFLKTSLRLPLNIDGYQVLISVLAFLVSTFAYAGVVSVVLTFVTEGRKSLKAFFIPLSTYLRFLVATVLYVLGLLVGFVLLIFPAVWFGSRYFFWPYIILSNKVSIGHAFKESARMTKGAKFEVFLFWFLSMIITYSGVLVAGIGYLITFPVVAVASAYVYKQMSIKSAE